MSATRFLEIFGRLLDPGTAGALICIPGYQVLFRCQSTGPLVYRAQYIYIYIYIYICIGILELSNVNSRVSGAV